MGEAGTIEDSGRSVAAPLIFLIVVALQLGSKYLDDLKKKAGTSSKEVELRAEIKGLLREANSLSQPSTFAQAAKLRRVAAAKEKELTNYQESHGKEMNKSYDLYLKFAFILKILTYFLIICWFWRTPVTAVSHKLVQPFGKLLSWSSGGQLDIIVRVGVMPWLILCIRVSRFVCRFVKL